MKITRTEAGAIPVYKDGDRDPTEWEVLAEQAFADEFDAEIAGLSKHEGGGHDQKTHGNWARGLRATPGRLASALGEDALTPAMSQAVEHATDQAPKHVNDKGTEWLHALLDLDTVHAPLSALADRDRL